MAELKKVFWDAGHGGSDPGAVKYVKESEVNIKVVNYAAAYMEEHYECEVRKDITADSINTVVARANEWEADLFASVHFNAGGGDGYEALVYSSKNESLGRCFEKYVEDIGQESRGVKYRPDLGVLRLTDMKAILNECAFVDNKEDIKDWNEDHELKVMGVALAKAAADWLDLPKKKVETKKSETKKSVSYETGDTCTLQANMKVRAGAGTNYRQKKRSELTTDGKKHAYDQTYAVLKKGTRVTVQKVVKKGNDIWLKIPSGYICAKQGSKIYIK